LPYWLVPYHQYTAASMVLALLLAGAKSPDLLTYPLAEMSG
jgi:hypothetical protein